MFEWAAAADEGQPLPSRSTSTARRRGIRGCEEAKKRRRAEQIVRASSRLWLNADVGVTGEDDESGGMCFLPNRDGSGQLSALMLPSGRVGAGVTAAHVA